MKHRESSLSDIKDTSQSHTKNNPPTEISFLNIHALNQSFLEKSSSSSDDSSSGESFDKSSVSNPYETSSDSDAGDYDRKEKDKATKLQNLLSIEKSNKNISVLLQFYLAKETNFADLSENTSKLLKKLNLPKFDMVIFFIAATIKYKEDDANILREKLRFEFLDKALSKSGDSKLHQVIQHLIGDTKTIDKDSVVHLFIEHSAYFLQRVLEDKHIYYDLFIEIISSGEISQHSLSNKIFIQTSTLNRVLSEKRYPQLLYLVSNNIRIMHNQLINFNAKEDQFTFEGYLNKPLLKINLKLLAIYFTSKVKDFNFIKKFLFDVRQSISEYKELLKVFIGAKANSLAKETFKALADSAHLFDNKLIFFALKVQNYEFLWFLAHHQIYTVSNWLQEDECQKTLVEYLATSEGKNFEYTIYFLKRVKRMKQKQTIKRMSEILINRLHSSRQGQFLYTFYNPLKISLLVVELMQQTIPNVMHHKNRLEKTLDLYYRFSQTYCSLITEDSHLIDIFKDIDLERRKVVYLIDANKSAIIQSSQIVEDAIESMWNGNIAPQYNILNMFSVTQTLFYEDLSDYMIEKHPKKNSLFLILNKFYQNHHFCLQRVVWTFNCRIRNQIDQCLILILMVTIFLNFSSLFDPQLKIQALLENYTDISEITEQDHQYVNELKDQYLKLQIYIDIIVGLNFTCKPLFILYYDWTQQVRTIFNAQDYNGFVLGLFSLFQLGFFLHMENLSEPSRFNVLINFRWIYISLTMLQCIHAIRNFKLFGPMIKALWLVVLECSKLFFIFLIVMMLFGFCAYFSFYENSVLDFKSLGKTMLFLIEALFGQFSFADFNQPSPIYAPIFLNIYLFFSPIIFMQLIVAVLTFTFETASRSGRVHYYLGIIENLRNLEYDAISGCLVTIPIVGSIFNIAFILSHMFSDPDPLLKEQNLDFLKRVNRVLVKGAYYPIYGVLALFCIVMVVACAPILYFVKAIRILKEQHQGQGYSRKNRFFTWIACGFYYMARESYRDFQTNHTYLMHGKFLNDSPQINISNTLYSIVGAVAKDFYLKTRERQTKVMLPEYLNAVLKKMKIIEQKQAEKLRKEQELQHAATLESEPLSNNNITTKQEITVTLESTRYHEETNPLKKSARHPFFSEKTLPDSQLLTDSQQKMNQLPSLFQKKDLASTFTAAVGAISFSNRIRSLISSNGDSEASTNNQQQRLAESDVPKSSKKLNGLQRSFTTNPEAQVAPRTKATPSIIFEMPQETGSHTDIPDDVFLGVIPSKETRRSILLDDNQQQAQQQSSTTPKHSSEPSLPRRSSMRVQLDKQSSHLTPDTRKKAEKINFEVEESESKDEEEDDHTSKAKKKERQGGRHLSSGSNSVKNSHKASHQSAQLQAYENQVHQRKRQRTTYQMWKKMRKEDHSGGGNIIKDTDQLYQFLDAFVVDEEEPLAVDQATQSKGEIEEESSDCIYIENLLKLMYHYSKNDVKLARFNILSQAIKKTLN